MKLLTSYFVIDCQKKSPVSWLYNLHKFVIVEFTFQAHKGQWKCCATADNFLAVTDPMPTKKLAKAHAAALILEQYYLDILVKNRQNETHDPSLANCLAECLEVLPAVREMLKGYSLTVLESSR